MDEIWIYRPRAEAAFPMIWITSAALIKIYISC